MYNESRKPKKINTFCIPKLKNSRIFLFCFSGTYRELIRNPGKRHISRSRVSYTAEWSYADVVVSDWLLKNAELSVRNRGRKVTCQ